MLWGLYYALLLVLEKVFLGKWMNGLPSVLQHIYTLLLVLIGWVIFAMEDMTAMGIWFKAMFGGAELVDTQVMFYLKNYGAILLIGTAAAFPWWKRIQRQMENRAIGKVVQAVLWIGLFVLCLAFLVGDTYNPFLYFRF